MDPRSLMQGDYMALNFAFPTNEPAATERSAQVMAQADARGVATLLRFHDGSPLARGEFLMNVLTKQNRWALATDAWYFKEGEAERWSKARYGEFRAKPDGSALLVGLRGPALEKL